MTEHEKLMKIFDEVDTHCDNTFCNTCPYNLKDSHFCVRYAYADKLIEYGYSQNNLLNKDTIRKVVREELHSMFTDILNSIDDKARQVNARDLELPMIIIKAFETVQKRYENE